MNKDRIALPAAVCRLDGSVVCMDAFTCIISITVGATKKLAVCLIRLRVAGTCHLSLYPEATFPRIFCARPKCMHASASLLATDRDAELLGPFPS